MDEARTFIVRDSPSFSLVFLCIKMGLQCVLAMIIFGGNNRYCNEKWRITPNER